MNGTLSLSPVLRAMVEAAGVADVHDFAPSAHDCECPVVICNERYERTDLLEDCEYGHADLDVVVVRETRDEACAVAGSIVYGLHDADWERWSSERIRIRSISVLNLPERLDDDGSGRARFEISVRLEVCVSFE